MNKGLKRLGARVVRFREIGALSGLIIIMIIFTILSNKFLTWANLIGVFTITSELGIIAIGVCFLMISGEFDLSVGSVFAIAPMVGALLGQIGVPLILAFFVGLFAAAVIGFINGILVTKSGIPSFIVTLGAICWLCPGGSQ